MSASHEAARAQRRSIDTPLLGSSSLFSDHDDDASTSSTPDNHPDKSILYYHIDDISNVASTPADRRRFMTFAFRPSMTASPVRQSTTLQEEGIGGGRSCSTGSKVATTKPKSLSTLADKLSAHLKSYRPSCRGSNWWGSIKCELEAEAARWMAIQTREGGEWEGFEGMSVTYKEIKGLKEARESALDDGGTTENKSWVRKILGRAR